MHLKIWTERLQQGAGEALDCIRIAGLMTLLLKSPARINSTGNFTVDLELVLNDLDLFDKLTFEIKTKSTL